MIKKIIYISLLYLLIQTVLSLIIISKTMPLGGGDAMAVWNLKARFIFLENGRFWTNLLSPVIFWSHPNYPLLLPFVVAFLWKIIGSATFLAPLVLSLVVTMLVPLVLFFGVKRSNNIFSAFLAVLVLVSTPFFVSCGASQYADIPLSLFLLFSLICLFHKKYLFAGLSIGASSGIKNEGIIFFLSIFLAYILLIILKKQMSNCKKDLIPYLVGSLPFIVGVLIFKLFFQTEVSYISQNFSMLISKIFDIERHLIIINRFLYELVNFGEWKINPLLILAGLIIFLKQKPGFLKNINFLVLPLSVLIIAFAYYAIYLISPYNLAWQLDTSLNRLFIQLWPSVIFIIFTYVYVQLFKRDK